MNASKTNLNLPAAIFESLSKYWKETDSGDFQVKVDGETFSCHRYFLESCSEYFRCLFRTDMKEKQEMKVELKNVSAATFRLVLKTLYEGNDLLTRENFPEYWPAVDMLQIPFLIKQCEEFAEKNLGFDTLESFKSLAEYLQSKEVLSLIFSFMVKNFVNFRQTEGFLKLSFEELRALIKSDELVVDSEDSVILSVFEWVTYGEVMRALEENDDDERAYDMIVNNEILNEALDASSNYNDYMESSQATVKRPSENEDWTETVNQILEKEWLVLETKEDEPNLRKKMLFELINSTRYCLVSDTCYANLNQNNLALNDTWVREIVSNAVDCKKSCIDRGTYPSAAIHRDCSSFEHVAVTSYDHRLYSFSFKKKKYFRIANLRDADKLTAFMGQLYACLSTEGSTTLHVFKSNEWLRAYGPMANGLGDVKLCIGHKNCMYLFMGKRIRRFDIVSTDFEFETKAPSIMSPEYALSFYDTILVFSSVKGSSGVDETSVYSWNPDTNVWDQVYILPFSCQSMVSFYDDVNSYILDSNGSLWKLSNSNFIEFAFLANLWTLTTTPLRGAVLFKDTLYIVADVKPQNFVTSVEDVFSAIHFLKLDKTSSLVHYVIDKRYLGKSKNVNDFELH